eukprot:scaffold6659_cov115-Pinguiococcus_pyrenoidosus.AAC.1
MGGVEVMKLRTVMLAQAGCPTIRLPASQDAASPHAAGELPPPQDPLAALPGSADAVLRIY